MNFFNLCRLPIFILLAEIYFLILKWLATIYKVERNICTNKHDSHIKLNNLKGIE